jgi:hypothetical protein
MKYNILLLYLLIVILTRCSQKDAAIRYTVETHTKQVKTILRVLDRYGTNADSTMNFFC